MCLDDALAEEKLSEAAVGQTSPQPGAETAGFRGIRKGLPKESGPFEQLKEHGSDVAVASGAEDPRDGQSISVMASAPSLAHRSPAAVSMISAGRREHQDVGRIQKGAPGPPA